MSVYENDGNSRSPFRNGDSPKALEMQQHAHKESSSAGSKHGPTDREKERESSRSRVKEKERSRDKDRERDRDKDRERDRGRVRVDRDKDRDRDREKDRDRHNWDHHKDRSERRERDRTRDKDDDDDYHRIHGYEREAIMSDLPEFSNTLDDGVLEDEELNGENETVQAKGKSKKISIVWDHFTPLPKAHATAKQYASCNYCNKKMVAGNLNGTSSLLRHLQGPCPAHTIESIRGRKDKALNGYKFDQLKSRKDFATAVIKHNYPFKMVEHKYFKIFLEGVNPAFELQSRNTLRADIAEIYEEETVKIGNILNNLTSKVSLTTDMWTSDHSHDPYCCLTVHYIDEDWKLNHKVISFKNIPHPHDGSTLFEFMKEMLLHWNLDKKLFTLVVDNASANDSMMRRLKDWFFDTSIHFKEDFLHVRCSAHVLNLIVQDGLSQITGLIENIRATVRYLKKSPSAEQKFQQAKVHCKLENRRSVAMDVSNRWNSTFELLETALPLQDAFFRLMLMDANYHHLPSAAEWKTAEVIMGCLQGFYDATLHFSGRSYPTSNVFFPDVCMIKLKLMEWRDSDDDLLRELAIPMKKKFDKYWDECSLVLAVAVVFDPRFKMQVVEYFYGLIYGIDAPPYIHRVHEAIKDLFFSYGGSIHSSPIQVVTSNYTTVAKRAKLSGFDNWCDQSRASLGRRKSELDLYLDEERFPRVEDSFNILDWWKLNHLRFPILGKIARDILAVPATTVASEAAFSVGGRILDESRSCLLPDIVEALIVAADLID